MNEKKIFRARSTDIAWEFITLILSNILCITELFKRFFLLMLKNINKSYTVNFNTGIWTRLLSVLLS